MYQYSVLFHGRIIFHCTDTQHFRLFITSGHLGYFHFLTIMNNAMNIYVQVFAWTYVLNSLERYLKVELLGPLSILRLTFWGTANGFPKWLPFYIPTSKT